MTVNTSAYIDSVLNTQTINNSIRTLLGNDLSYQNGKQSPVIWECSWYNDMQNKSGYGYERGSAVWINTEDVDQFVLSREQDIYEYLSKNPQLSRTVETLKTQGDREQLLDLYRKVVRGDDGYQNLYYLGNLSDEVQIRISKCDGNTHLPNDDKYWDDFIRRDLSEEYFLGEINTILGDRLSSRYVKHLVDYHMFGTISAMSQSEACGITSSYIRSDMSNFKGQDELKSHQYSTDLSGNDYVTEFKSKHVNGQLRWFRVWHSGLLEHGGEIDVSRPQDFGDSNRYGNASYKVNLGWTVDGTTARVYNYPTIAAGSFYNGRSTIDYCTDFFDYQYTDSETAVDGTYRYQVQVTPIDTTGTIVPYSKYNGYRAKCVSTQNTDITNIDNDSFSFTIGAYSRFSFYARGFVQKLI